MNIIIEFCKFELVLVPNFTLNWQFWFSDQICPKRVIPVEKGKSEHYFWILHIRIRLGTKFQPKQTILIFLDQTSVTLAIYSIQQHFIRGIRAKFGIPILPQSLDIGQNLDGRISDFRISSQSFINENCHNSSTSHDIGMKLGPVTKLNKKSSVTSKKSWRWRHIGNLWRHCLFSIYDQFAAIRKPDSWCMVYKTYIFINNNLLSCKTSKQN